jgi:protein-disulfide isomerase
MSLVVPINKNDHVLGPSDAPVSMVEYGDFECPHCAAAHLVLKNVLKRMGPRLRFVYRHMPLTQVHPNAELAAEASEAAGAQGKFWQVHDALFEHQLQLSPVLIPILAERLGLDMKRIVEDLAARRYRDKVREDFMGAVRSGAAGTPTFFINGERHEGGYDETSIVAALDVAARTRVA